MNYLLGKIRDWTLGNNLTEYWEKSARSQYFVHMKWGKVYFPVNKYKYLVYHYLIWPFDKPTK